MGTIKDLTNQRFTKLVALKYFERRGNQAAWLCRCDCGNETVVLSGNLRAGHTRSCGCIRGQTVTGGQNRGRANKYTEPLRPLDPIIHALRKRRYDLGLTQEAVAKRMGWEQRSLCSAEAGKVAPTFGFVFAWAQALGMKLKLEDGDKNDKP